jgi:hypothetical protein
VAATAATGARDRRTAIHHHIIHRNTVRGAVPARRSYQPARSSSITGSQIAGSLWYGA